MLEANRGALRVVCISDTAIDIDSMDTHRYVRTREEQLVVVNPGQRATWFVLRSIPRSVFTRFVAAAPTESERHERAFSVGVERIEWLDEKNPTLSPSGEIQAAVGTIPRWTDRDLEGVSPAYVDEVGGVAWWRSFLAHEAAPKFPVRPLFVSVLAARASRLVAEIRKSATAQNNGEPSGLSVLESDETDGADTSAPAKERPISGSGTKGSTPKRKPSKTSRGSGRKAARGGRSATRSSRK